MLANSDFPKVIPFDSRHRLSGSPNLTDCDLSLRLATKDVSPLHRQLL